MSNSIERSPESKREFYARPEIARSYTERRFGGASGAWVSEREVGLVLSLQPDFRRALDLGCGTGRLARVLQPCGTAVGLDSSAAMLREARQASPLTLVQGNAFALPFADASFDLVVALRLVFHFQELAPLFTEIARVLPPHGAAVFDTYRWSPRAWLPLDRGHWGGGVFAHSPAQVSRAAERSGLSVAHRVSCFLFSPYLYRRLPLALVHWLDRVEKRIPESGRARVFWKLEKAALPE